MAFSIRPVTEDDIPDLAHIHVSGWQTSGAGIVDQNYLDSLRAEDRLPEWQKWMAAEDAYTLLASDENKKPVGFINYGRLKTPLPGMSPIRPLYSSEIYALYILEPYWQKGLGQQLMKEAARELTGLKHKSLCLWVLEKNKRAVSFYKNLEGERCGKKNTTLGPTTAREICFGWRDMSVLL